MTPGTAETRADSREIRVFLSSTFRDFMAERDRLVKQVFPELRRKARERGVEVVEVDLRWGITEEESRQGKVLPICLAEIRRCRPYFIGMLGDRYGWVPPNDDDNRAVLAEEAWVEEHLGQRSVTEMEILHGVLREPEMAGRAFFYFRDPVWSRRQTEPGFVCDNEEEKEKLADLKQRIRSSRFPLVENLPDPDALADRIGADLWALIEEQFPELDQPDALEREERKHASYRRARTDLYEDGGTGCVKVSQLEQWIATGEQRILITGESGAGKSALIANWMERHQQQHPEDVFHAHHLGCSNDANALEPMLARMVQAASKLMAEELIEPIKVPQDYWELVKTVTDSLSQLSTWCKRHGRRWILVLDGLDRLPEENQQALPWLPLQLFPHLHVVFSALDCQARTILQQRNYTTLEIGPLDPTEQRALIQATMRRYNKTLVPELEAKILKHEPARSPLFLRVVLDELRVCGRHETLTQQLEDYLTANSVDALYAKVLARLELDVGREPVEKVMTALWASRAGLSETELRAISGVAPLQWAPIDLGLEGAFGRNGNGLVFDHDYLRQAVEDRYLPGEEVRRQAHSELADWFEKRQDWNERDAEEWPWQLQQAGRIADLRDLLLNVNLLSNLVEDVGSQEVLGYWQAARQEAKGELDDLIAEDVAEEIEKRREDPQRLIKFVDLLALLLDDAGLYRELLLRLRSLSLELEKATEGRDEVSVLMSLSWLASAQKDQGKYEEAAVLFLRCLEARERLLGREHPSTLSTANNLAELYRAKGDYEKAEAFSQLCLEAKERLLGREHPSTLTTVNNLALLYNDQGNYEKAEAFYQRCLEATERLLGREHPNTLSTVGNLAGLYKDKGDYEKAEAFFQRCLEAEERLLGREHPSTLTIVGNLAVLYQAQGDYEKAEAFYQRDLEASERLLGREHPSTNITRYSLANLLSAQGRYTESIPLIQQELKVATTLYGRDAPGTLNSISTLANDLEDNGDSEAAEPLYRECMNGRIATLGDEDPATMASRYDLAGCLSALELYEESIQLRRIELAWCQKEKGAADPDTLASLGALARDLSWNDEVEEAEALYRQVLQQTIENLGEDHPETMGLRYGLARTLSAQERYDEAIKLRRIDLAWRREALGDQDVTTLISINALANDLEEDGDPEAAETLYRECLAGRIEALGNEHHATMASRYDLACCLSNLGRYEDAIELRRIELAWCQKEQGSDAPGTIASLGALAQDLLLNDEPEEAEIFFRQALNQASQNLGEGHAETMGLRHGLARTLSAQERYDEAIELRLIEVAWHREALGDHDPIILTSIHGLASDLEASGDPEAAEPLYREYLKGRIETLGDEHPTTMASRFMLAGCLSSLLQYEEAIELRQIELAWRRDAQGDRDRITLICISSLASDLEASGDLEAAEPLYRECLNGRIETLGDEHHVTMASRYDLAGCLSALELYDESIELRRIELAWCQRERGVDDPGTLLSQKALGVDLLHDGQAEAGLDLLQDCLTRQQRVLGPTDDSTLGTVARVLDALSSLERHEEAIALSQKVQRALEKERGSDDPEVLIQLSNQAQLYELLDRLEDAEPLWRRCLQGHEQISGADHPSTILSLYGLATVLRELNSLEEAEVLYTRGLHSLENSRGPDHPDTIYMAYGLAWTLSALDRHSEAIPLRRRELAFCIQQNGDADPDTLISINYLAIDLRATGELEESEVLFRRLVTASQEVLEPGDFDIGRALGGLAKTLKEAGKLTEALIFARQALDHRFQYKGPDAWWTNKQRHDLARVLHKLERNPEANALLQELHLSMARNDDLDDRDRQLISDAAELLLLIEKGLPEA